HEHMVDRELINRVRPEVRSPEGDAYEPFPDGVPSTLKESATIVGELRHEMLAIKEGETFVCSDDNGDLPFANSSGMGVYYKDTRFLSRFEFRLNGAPLVLLSASAERSFMSQIDLTNRDIWREGSLTIPQQTLNVRRTRVAGPR